MIKKKPQLNQNNVNKSHREAPGERSIFSINRINENQQVVLMRINKVKLLRNKNDNRFHSSVDNRTPRAYQKNVILSRVKIPIVSISRPGACGGKAKQRA